MTQYGEIIDNGYDPKKEQVYNIFAKYFNNPKMVKIKDVKNYSMYGVKINIISGIEYRYILVFVEKDKNSVGYPEDFLNLNWIVLQTRTLQDEYNIPVHDYIPRRIPELECNIKSIDTNYNYMVEKLPIKITLIPKNGGLEYHSSGTLLSAIETYQTIVSF
jgi:hypothetical protein